MKKITHIVLISSVCLLTSVACQNQSSDTAIQSQILSDTTSGQAAQNQVSKYDINAYPLHKLVCDPFDPNPGNSPEFGIQASLWFRGKNPIKYTSVNDYINNYTKSSQKLIFNSINVPTRIFSTGFPLMTGGMVKDDTGNDLIEYFAMKFESDIVLNDTDEEGMYELAVLSDDGTVLKIKEPDMQGVVPSEWETHINNDGDTPTRMKCSQRTVFMKKGQKMPMELSYYQGPKYHISNMLIWRKASVAGQDALCNKSGNTYFFDPNNNSAPLKWSELEQRGWRPLASSNYLMPVPENQTQTDVTYNACASGTIPQIANFKIVNQTDLDTTVSWNTDIPSVGQVLITNLTTGERTITDTDNILRTTHTIKILNLISGYTYRLQAVSISESLGRSISAGIDITL